MTRFVSIYDDIIGYIKLFFIIFAIAFVFLFIALGGGKWAFWGAAAIGGIIALIAIAVIAILTGYHDQFGRKG